MAKLILLLLRYQTEIQSSTGTTLSLQKFTIRDLFAGPIKDLSTHNKPKIKSVLQLLDGIFCPKKLGNANQIQFEAVKNQSMSYNPLERALLNYGMNAVTKCVVNVEN